jgi:hypothetical protein
LRYGILRRRVSILARPGCCTAALWSLNDKAVRTDAVLSFCALFQPAICSVTDISGSIGPALTTDSGMRRYYTTLRSTLLAMLEVSKVPARMSFAAGSSAEKPITSVRAGCIGGVSSVWWKRRSFSERQACSIDSLVVHSVVMPSILAVTLVTGCLVLFLRRARARPCSRWRSVCRRIDRSAATEVSFWLARALWDHQSWAQFLASSLCCFFAADNFISISGTAKVRASRQSANECECKSAVCAPLSYL